MRMKAENKQRVRKFYAGRLDRYGQTPEASDWGSFESQEARLRIMAQMVAFPGKRILDVGCGLGNLFGFLEKGQIDCDYMGVDIVPEVVDAACRAYPKGSFQVLDILEQRPPGPFDLVCLSGTLNLRIENHGAWVREMVEKMFEIAREAVVFNLMSLHADFTDPQYYYADPVKLVSHAFSLTRNLVLNHGYMPHDMTLVLKKDEWRS